MSTLIGYPPLLMHLWQSRCQRRIFSVLILLLSSQLVQSWTSGFQGASSILPHSGPSEQLDFETDLYYKITWNDDFKVSENRLSSNLRGLNDEDYVVSITSSNNEKYRCHVPNHKAQLNFDDSAKNSSDEDASNNSPFRTLEPVFNRGYCSYRFEPFWVYELCHGKFLRQYHEESDKLQATQEYFLGLFRIAVDLKPQEQQYEKQMDYIRRTGAERPTISVGGHQKPYLLVNMTAGTHCDLTNTSRMTKVYYVCSEGSKHELYSIKETSTCEYEAIVLSPMLCSHRDFKQESTHEHEIACYPEDGAPTKPKALDKQDEDDTKSKSQRKVAFFDGRTLIIDAEDIDGLLFN